MADNNRNADLIMLKGFARGNKEVIIKLIHVFLRNTPAMIDDLEKKFIDNDAEQVKLIMHKLTSQFIFMNFDTGEKILLNLRTGFESGTESGALHAQIHDLKEACNKFYEILNFELNKLQ